MSQVELSQESDALVGVMAASEFRREAKKLGFSERMAGTLKGKQARCLYCDTRIPWRPSRHGGDAPVGALEQLRDHRKRCDAKRKKEKKR